MSVARSLTKTVHLQVLESSGHPERTLAILIRNQEGDERESELKADSDGSHARGEYGGSVHSPDHTDEEAEAKSEANGSHVKALKGHPARVFSRHVTLPDLDLTTGSSIDELTSSPQRRRIPGTDVYVVDHDGQNGQAEDEGLWQCRVCGYRNAAEDSTCKMCKTMRAGEAWSPPGSPSAWSPPGSLSLPHGYLSEGGGQGPIQGPARQRKRRRMLWTKP